MADRICSVARCGREVRYKFYALCQGCYLRKRRAGEIDGMRSGRPCVSCGEEIIGRTAKAIYCTEECRLSKKRASATQKMRRENAKRRAGRTCAVCGTDISARKLGARYCGTFCSERSRGFHLLGPSALRVCALPECGAEFESFRGSTRTCCETHLQTLWKREARAEGRAPNQPWDDRRRNNYHKRRALKAGSSAGPAFSNATVFERDGWVCGLCDESVPRDAVWPDPLSASLDHVVPLSRGGAHSLENVQLAHLSCNVRKGAREDVSVMA